MDNNIALVIKWPVIGTIVKIDYHIVYIGIERRQCQMAEPSSMGREAISKTPKPTERLSFSSFV
jgi:hypothetical protein